MTDTRTYRWRVEKELRDGRREFVGWADAARADKLRTAGFVVTEVKW